MAYRVATHRTHPPKYPPTHRPATLLRVADDAPSHHALASTAAWWPRGRLMVARVHNFGSCSLHVLQRPLAMRVTSRAAGMKRERERARAFVCSRTSVFSICSNDFAVCYCCCCRCCCVLTGYDATVSVHQWPHTGLAQASLEMVVNFSALSISRPRCVFKSLSIGCRRGPGVLPSKQSYLCPLSPFTGFHARACF